MRCRAEGWSAAAAALLLLTGCAGTGLPFGGAPAAPAFRQPSQSVPAAAQSLTVGRSTRTDVHAALGPAEVLRFDSGHEVWVYRAKPARDARTTPELVVLFSPQGTLAKVRARPAYPPAD